MASDSPRTPKRRFRSRDWFDDPAHIDMVALYLERFMNYGLTAEELLGGKPIIGIAQTGGDLTPCNRIHLETAKRVREGIRDAGGDPARIAAEARKDIAAFLELHIEQGPVLETEKLDIGVVTAIAGITRIEIIVQGRADHAGRHQGDAPL
jgi:hypothetical protein